MVTNMKDNQYLDNSLIENFFKMLNESGINYVLIKNIGEELPNHLKDGKDIDILVKLEDREAFMKVMLNGGFLKRIHPLGKEAGWRFGYQLPEYQFWQLGGIEQVFYIDCCFKLMCKSLTPKYWVPLDRCINNSVWENKVWDAKLNCWKIDDKTLLSYLLARCVFDKRTFSEVYKEDIEKLLCYIDDSDVQTMLETIFYKFTPVITEMLKAGKYDEIVRSYISFKNY